MDFKLHLIWIDGNGVKHIISEMPDVYIRNCIKAIETARNSVSTSAEMLKLSEIRGVTEYQAVMGTVVNGADGQEHIIEYDGVVGHPGNEEMKVIAERIVELVK